MPSWRVGYRHDRAATNNGSIALGYAVGVGAYLTGLVSSILWDIPPGPVIVWALVVLAVAVGWAVVPRRASADSPCLPGFCQRLQISVHDIREPLTVQTRHDLAHLARSQLVHGEIRLRRIGFIPLNTGLVDHPDIPGVDAVDAQCLLVQLAHDAGFFPIVGGVATCDERCSLGNILGSCAQGRNVGYQRTQVWIVVVVQKVSIEVCQTSKTDTSRRTDDEDQAYLINGSIEVCL